MQTDWNGGSRWDWVRTLDAAIHASEVPVVLVAHSLGNMVVAHWAAAHSGPVIGALLVAPADVEANWVPSAGLYREFVPIPMEALPFPSILVASSNDRYLSIGRARQLAVAWGSDLRRAGAHGHLGSDSGLEDWPAGRELLDEVVVRANRFRKG